MSLALNIKILHDSLHLLPIFILTSRILNLLLLFGLPRQGFLQKMLWLSIIVKLRLGFTASIAFYSATEVVVLALRAYPTSIREVESLLILACTSLS